MGESYDAGKRRSMVCSYLRGTLHISEDSALKNYLDAENAEIRREPQRNLN